MYYMILEQLQCSASTKCNRVTEMQADQIGNACNHAGQLSVPMHVCISITKVLHEDHLGGRRSNH